jgi:hypothetical protein
MDDVTDDNQQKFTIRVQSPHGEVEVFYNATEIERDCDDLDFKDKNGKVHNFHGHAFHVAEE